MNSAMAIWQTSDRVFADTSANGLALHRPAIFKAAWRQKTRRSR